MRVIAEQFEPENCKDCRYVLTGTSKDHSGDVYVCPLIGLEEVSEDEIDERCPWDHFDDEKLANYIVSIL